MPDADHELSDFIAGLPTEITDNLTASMIQYTPSGGLTGTDVQSAIDELDAGVPGSAIRLFQYFVDVDSNATFGVDVDAYTSTIPANRLSNDGDTLQAQYTGLAAKNANNKAVRVKFAGTTIFDSGNINNSAFGDWKVVVQIIRESNTQARCVVTLVSDFITLVLYTLIAALLDFTTAEDLVLVIFADTSDTDNVAKMGTVDLVLAV